MVCRVENICHPRCRHQASVLPSGVTTVAVEAGVRQGWTGFGVRGALGLDRLGLVRQVPSSLKNLFTCQGIVEQVLKNALQ